MHVMIYQSGLTADAAIEMMLPLLLLHANTCVTVHYAHVQILHRQ